MLLQGVGGLGLQGVGGVQRRLQGARVLGGVEEGDPWPLGWQGPWPLGRQGPWPLVKCRGARCRLGAGGGGQWINICLKDQKKIKSGIFCELFLIQAY